MKKSTAGYNAIHSDQKTGNCVVILSAQVMLGIIDDGGIIAPLIRISN
jgi:hypothetical protein